MKLRYEYAGINNKDSGLEVFVEQVIGTTRRVFTITIPWNELCDEKTLHYIDRGVRAQLAAAWNSSAWADENIPGIG